MGLGLRKMDEVGRDEVTPPTVETIHDALNALTDVGLSRFQDTVLDALNEQERSYQRSGMETDNKDRAELVGRLLYEHFLRRVTQ